MQQEPEPILTLRNSGIGGSAFLELTALSKKTLSSFENAMSNLKAMSYVVVEVRPLTSVQ